MKKPDSRFTFEKGYCPFVPPIGPEPITGKVDYWYCTGPKCELWMVEQNQGRDLGCSIRIQAGATRNIAGSLRVIDKTLLQILGHLKTNK